MRGGSHQMHRRLPVTALAVLAAIAVVIAAGAAFAATAVKKAGVKQVAIATPAKPSDYGWNQQGYNAAKAAAASIGAKFVAQTNIGYDKTEAVLRQLAQGGAGFIVAHASGYDTVASRIAVQYKVPVMTYDIPTQVIATGADVIFGMGDNASFGYLQGIETAKAGHKVWFIGDIGNMGPIDKHHVLLSSVLWSFTDAYKKALADINGGTYGTHGYNLTLANGGISLLKTRYISAKVWNEIRAAQTRIQLGKLKVPLTTKAPQVKALINQK